MHASRHKVQQELLVVNWQCGLWYSTKGHIHVLCVWCQTFSNCKVFSSPRIAFYCKRLKVLCVVLWQHEKMIY